MDRGKSTISHSYQKQNETKKMDIILGVGEIFFLGKIKGTDYPISNYHPWKHT